MHVYVYRICDILLVIVIVKFILKYIDAAKSNADKSMQTQKSHKSILVPNKYVIIHYIIY